MNQTLKPDKIILWLAESQFPDKKLPALLDEVKACGVDVKFCPEDLGPHKKYYYTMKKYPDDIIITFDDDWIYQSHIIEMLYKSYLEHPYCVSAMTIHKINFKQNGSIANYESWDIWYSNAAGHESYIYHGTNGGGTLFPPHTISNEVFNIEAIKKICPLADDVWMKFMEVMNGTKVVPASNIGGVPGWGIPNSQEYALWKSNNLEGGNDVQINAMLEAYSDWRSEDGRTIVEVMRGD